MKRFSTEALVKALLGPTLCNYDVAAIIARLRSADKMCEAAKGVTGSYPEDEEIYEHTWEKFKKAIAEYEEGE